MENQKTDEIKPERFYMVITLRELHNAIKELKADRREFGGAKRGRVPMHTTTVLRGRISVPKYNNCAGERQIGDITNCVGKSLYSIY